MKSLFALLAVTALSGNIAIMPAFADDSTISSQTDNSRKSSSLSTSDKQEYQSMLKESSTMMGYAGVASMAILYDREPQAKDNVQKALVIARKLEAQTSQLNGDVIKLGKLKYHSANGDKHDYWLPVVDDNFAVNTLDLTSKSPHAMEDDAQVFSVKVALNIKSVRDSLEKAAASIDRRDYRQAEVDLTNAQQSTYSDESVTELPLVTARDNLALARVLAKSNDYNGANFALTHAKNALAEYQKTAEKEKSAQVDKMQAEISALQTHMADAKASESAHIQKHISAWMHNIDGLGIQNG